MYEAILLVHVWRIVGNKNYERKRGRGKKKENSRGGKVEQKKVTAPDQSYQQTLRPLASPHEKPFSLPKRSQARLDVTALALA